MPRHRDRHDRGLRGPLASSASPTMQRALRRRQLPPAAWFEQCVQESIARIIRTCPQALSGVDVGVDDVPPVRPGDVQVPLAAAVEATATQPAQVVIYRRPLEHRASHRRHLAQLVHRTLVEQLAAVTAYSASQIDPDLDRD